MIHIDEICVSPSTPTQAQREGDVRAKRVLVLKLRKGRREKQGRLH